MEDKRDYRYSLFGRFISIVFLIFVSCSYFYKTHIDSIREEAFIQEVEKISSSININIGTKLLKEENKLLILSKMFANESIVTEKDIPNALKIFCDEYKTQKIQWIPNHKFNNDIVTKSPKTINNPVSIYFLNNVSDLLYLAIKVKTADGKYLGNLTSETNLKDLRDMELSQILNKDINVYFDVYNFENNKIITNSAKSAIQIKSSLKSKLEKFIESKDQSSFCKIEEKIYILSKIMNYQLVLVVAKDFPVSSYKDYIQGLYLYKYEILIFFVAISVLIYLFYNSILAPFLALSKAASAISHGELDITIPPIHNKESAMVAEALEKMKNSLQIEQNLVQEITQTRNSLSLSNLRLENKVAERTKELKNALIEKTSFLNNLSHEIKTPLQGVSTMVENIVNHWSELEDARKYEFLRQASYSTQYLSSLVVNLLEIARISDGKISLDLRNTDIVLLTKEVVKECKILYMHNKEVSIVVKSEKAIYANIDINRMKQVLRNIFLNAIKFSNNGGSISANITMTKLFTQDGLRQDGVQVSISDQGLGIPEDELSNIFSPFSEGSNAKTISVGSGLGLTICREIINAHYGKIWANNNKDGGATFSFAVPLVQPIEIVNHIPGNINLYRAGYNILMIDDEEICLNSMEMLLFGTEYNLIKISSAHFALDYLKKNWKAISVIFIDLMMPDIYGLNLISVIKEDPELRQIPIILQTSSSDEHEIAKAFEKGIYSFITKPYNKQKLLEELNKAIKYKAIEHNA